VAHTFVAACTAAEGVGPGVVDTYLALSACQMEQENNRLDTEHTVVAVGQHKVDAGHQWAWYFGAQDQVRAMLVGHTNVHLDQQQALGADQQTREHMAAEEVQDCLLGRFVAGQWCWLVECLVGLAEGALKKVGWEGILLLLIGSQMTDLLLVEERRIVEVDWRSYTADVVGTYA